jgi:hypothetical protein
MSVRLPREGHLPPSPHSPEPRARPSKTAASEQEGAAREGADHDASPFARLLGGLGREVNAGEAQVRGALDAAKRGAGLGPAELLALQAGVYRYSETVDLASKLVDRATSGVKTVVQGQ